MSEIYYSMDTEILKRYIPTIQQVLGEDFKDCLSKEEIRAELLRVLKEEAKSYVHKCLHDEVNSLMEHSLHMIEHNFIQYLAPILCSIITIIIFKKYYD